MTTTKFYIVFHCTHPVILATNPPIAVSTTPVPNNIDESSSPDKKVRKNRKQESHPICPYAIPLSYGFIGYLLILTSIP